MLSQSLTKNNVRRLLRTPVDVIASVVGCKFNRLADADCFADVGCLATVSYDAGRLAGLRNHVGWLAGAGDDCLTSAGDDVGRAAQNVGCLAGAGDDVGGAAGIIGRSCYDFNFL